jgi:uncharacterized protein YggE
MNSVVLRQLRVGGSVFSLVSLAAAGASGQGASAMPSGPAQVVTTGTGEARVTPDRAVISIGVQTRGVSAVQAAADNARRQRAILDTLRTLGATSDAVSTTDYNVFPEMNASSTQTPPKVTGYSVSNTIRVEVRKLDDISRFIDAALARGANTMSSLQFYSSKADSAHRVALAMAVANARADAETIARAGGGTLGPLLLLESDQMSQPRPLEMPMARLAIGAPTPIEAGQQTISASVTVRWAFLPAR